MQSENGHAPAAEFSAAEHGHDHDHGREDEGGEHGWPHEPAPPEPRHLLPERSMLIRGVTLLALAIGALIAAVGSVQKAGWLAAVSVAPVLALIGLLAGWAAAIHLTDGEKFDDHPWV